MNLPELTFRDRVTLLVVAPLVAVVLAGVPLLASQLGVVRAAESAADLARTAGLVRPLLGDLAAERTLALAALTGPAGRDDALLAAYSDTDARAAAAAGLDAAAGVRGLAPLREAVRSRAVDVDTMVAGYAAVGAALTDALGRPEDAVVATVLEGERRADIELALLRSTVDPGRAPAAAAAAIASGAAEAIHRRVAGDTGVLAAVRDGGAASRVAEAAAALRADPAGFAAARATDAGTLFAEVVAAASIRGLAQDRDLTAALDRSVATAAAARAAAAVLTTLFVVLAVAVAAIGTRNGRSVSRPLLRLAAAADQVAELAHAELLRVADSEDPAAPAPQLAAVNVDASDELGELAAAFNRVQAVAALLLERQSLVRRNSAAMLANVARRTRTLVARQLDLVDRLEQGEQDPVRLERLYRLDHLTSRLRRSADSLLVLASARDEDALAEPQPVVTVVRSALASIEEYRRVTIGAMVDAHVRPAVHADLALLVAELLENAVAFSPPSGTVTVDVVPAVDGCRLEVVDHGVGLAPGALERHNAAFLTRERLELAPADVLGLVVVGRIARRHGMTVHLRRTAGGGVTAAVAVPGPALVGPARAQAPPSTPDPPSRLRRSSSGWWAGWSPTPRGCGRPSRCPRTGC